MIVNVSNIKRFVAKRSDKSDNKNKFVIHYHIPIVGVVSGEGITEEEADKETRIKVTEIITKKYLEKLKDVQEFENLLAFK